MAETINKYATEDAYQADTHATSLDEVSLVTETGDIHYDGVNVIRPAGAVPEVGDALYVDSSGNKIFVSGKSKMVTADLPSGTEFTGAVCGRYGRKILLLHKDYQLMCPISHWAWEITGIQYNTSNTIVFQQYGLTAAGASTYQYYTIGSPLVFTPTSIDDAITKIDTWLNANPGGSAYNTLIPHEYNWFCRKIDDRIYVMCDPNKPRQYYMTNGNPVTIVDESNSGQIKSLNNMSELTGFIAANSVSILRNDGVVGSSYLSNADAFKVYNTSVESPTDVVGSKGIYNEAGFNQSTVVKEYYGTYDAYLNAYYPVYTNAYDFKAEPRTVTSTDMFWEPSYTSHDGLSTTHLYAMADFCRTRKAHSTASCAGLNDGDWGLPCWFEHHEIVRHLQSPAGTGHPYDPISSTFMQNGKDPSLLLASYAFIPRIATFYAITRRTYCQTNGINMNTLKTAVWPVAWITV